MIQQVAVRIILWEYISWCRWRKEQCYVGTSCDIRSR